MKTEIKQLDNSKVEISIEVVGDVVKNKFEDVFKKIGQEAKVSGFRPGHAPRDILEKKFSHLANEQVLKEMLPDIYDQAVKEHSLSVVNLPDISDVKLERNSLSFKAIVEITPEIHLKDYKRIKINYKKIEVSSDDVKRNIDGLKESKKADVVDDKFARILGYPDTAELERAVEKQIFIQKENQQRQKIENEIVQSLTAELDFKIPESLVRRQMEDLLKQSKLDLAMRGFTREKIEDQEKEMIKKLEPIAKNQVKVYLIFAEIAKRENIAIDEHMSNKVMELLLREADWVLV